MNRGAVALIDALGFKGIWGNRDKPSTAALKTLRAIGKAASSDVREASLRLDSKLLPQEIAQNLKDPFVKVIQLSDTVVIAAGRRPRSRKPWTKHAKKWKAKLGLTPDEIEAAMDAYLRYVVCKCVCSVLKESLLCELPLLFRGAVTVGAFEIDETFLLGPAVDEAAELMDLADGPFVWLAPSADRLRHVIKEPQDLWRDIAIKHRVPLKGGSRIPSRVLNVRSVCSQAEKDRIEKVTLRCLRSDKVDVTIKRGNAIDYFEAVKHHERMKALRAKYGKQK